MANGRKPPPPRQPQPGEEPRRASATLLVALGIAASRLSGLCRETFTSRILGNSSVADAFAVAMRIPNLLQNLLGEGVLSASFVPVYSSMLGIAKLEGDAKLEDGDTHEGDAAHEARQVAGAVAGILMTTTGICVLTLIAFSRPITFILAPGLSAERFELAVSLTRITAVGVGFAVMSAWCLGVLNSHKRFFLSYVAPVLWNTAQIGALAVAWLLAFDIHDASRALAWGVTIGGAAQILVQLPLTLRILRGVHLSLGRGVPHVQEIKRRFIPAILGRGVIQVTSYLDLILASMLATGAVAALSRSQTLYMLPISLFAMSVAAAELPEMSRVAQNSVALTLKAAAGTRKVVFWMLLVAVIYVTVGDMIVQLLFEGGRFSPADTVLVWFIIATYGLSLPATGTSRLLTNTCYAMGDTSGPARIAAARMLISTVVGMICMFPMDRVIVGAEGLLNIAEMFKPAWTLTVAEREAVDVVRLGAVGLAVGSTVAAWVEVSLLTRLLKRKLYNRRALDTQTPQTPGNSYLRDNLEDVSVYDSVVSLSRAGGATFLTAAVLKSFVGSWPIILATPLVLGLSVSVYTIVAYRSGVEESQLILKPIRKIIWHSHNRRNRSR